MLNICVYLNSAFIASKYANLNLVSVLNEINFKNWKEKMKIVLDCMDLDIALRIEKPTHFSYGL